MGHCNTVLLQIKKRVRPNKTRKPVRNGDMVLIGLLQRFLRRFVVILSVKKFSS